MYTIVMAFNKQFEDPAKVALHTLLTYGDLPDNTEVIAYLDKDINITSFDSFKDRVTFRHLSAGNIPLTSTETMHSTEHIYGTSLSVYAIDHVHKEGRQRVIWLDADLYVRKSIRKMITLEMDDCSIAAARDHLWDNITYINNNHSMEYKESPPFIGGVYFNAGVLVFDLQNFYKDAGWEINGFSKALTSQNGNLNYMEQDILNKYSFGNIHLLHQKYNWFVDWEHIYRDNQDEMNKKHTEMDCAIYHCVSPLKPWIDKELPIGEFRQQFRVHDYLTYANEIKHLVSNTFITQIENNL